MQIASLDHIVISVSCVSVASRGLYCWALGMEVLTFPEGRKALVFGQQKINPHEYGKGFGPRANSSATGSADSCFVSTESLEPVINPLRGAWRRNL